jgi:iron complex transport system permease protein
MTARALRPRHPGAPAETARGGAGAASGKTAGAPSGVAAASGRGLALACGACALLAALHLKLGVHPVAWNDVWAALAAFDPADPSHAVVRELRLPRMLVALAVGAASGVAGALIQSVTRNPVAAPDLLGVNAGAALAVVLATAAFGVGDPGRLVWAALAGAALAGATVYGIGAAGPGGATPGRLLLAGAAVAAFLSAVTASVLLLMDGTFAELRLWLAGSTAGGTADDLLAVLPHLAGGAALAALLSRPAAAMALGEEVAAGLGLPVSRVRLAAAAAVVLLSGASVALAGPIGFVGLVSPHLARLATGPGGRFALARAGAAGGLLLLAADLLARTLAAPQDVPTGVVTALLGAPVLVLLVRRGTR